MKTLFQFLLLALAVPALAASRPNVLFIAIDDLRNDLGALGAAHAKTPQLDAFAKTARVFSHHFVQVPTCGASRGVLLRGRYPTLPAHVGNDAIKTTHPQWASHSLPALFREHGYRTLALGKIGHYPGGLTGKGWAEGQEEMPGAWERCWVPEGPWKTPQALMHGYANGGARQPGKTPPWEAFEGPDEAYPDAHVAAEAVRTLDALARDGKPWFFAVGFFKPHLPFAAPKKWFDLHDAQRIPPPRVTDRPAAPSTWHGSQEFRGNYGHDGRDPETDADYARLLRHAYAAGISYVDAQVGRLLAAFEAMGLAKNTIVVIWSDHGFLLGEHAIWGKHCLYENALRSPLMIRTPDLAAAGRTSAAIVETVDIFPTLADLCALPAPAKLDGRSLRPQLDDPATPGTKPALGFWTKNRRTIRSERWRLIVHPGPANAAPEFELFDMTSDPDESRNVAAQHSQVVQELIARLP